MNKVQKTNEIPDEGFKQKIQTVLYELVSKVPKSKQHETEDPETIASAIAEIAARKAAAVSAGLALPPGPLGMATILPDLLGVWEIQKQMVADIAAVYGKTHDLTKETMVVCLFKHGGAKLVSEIFARVGERVIVRRTSLRALQAVLQKVGIRATQRVLGKLAGRWIPLIGAAILGAFSYLDTKKVGRNAIEIFSADILHE